MRLRQGRGATGAPRGGPEPKQDGAVGEADSVPFCDEARVPVETIELPDPQIEGLSPDEYEVIGQKVSYRLAQRPGSYVILKYLRSVIKRVDIRAISCAPAPVGVIEGSRADVSFVAGLLVDKFAYHVLCIGNTNAYRTAASKSADPG